MSILPTSILPKNILTALKRTPSQIQVSPLLVEAAQSEAAAVLRQDGDRRGGAERRGGRSGGWSSMAPTWWPRSSSTAGSGSCATPAATRW